MRQNVENNTNGPGNGSYPETGLTDQIDRHVSHAPAANSQGSRVAGSPRGEESAEELVLAPLVDKVAYGLARVLVVAMRDLEKHIAKETQRVGDTVGRRLDTLQASLQELTEAASEQRSLGLSVQQKCEQLTVATASLQERDTRQEAELVALRSETREFSTSVSERIDALGRELGVQQEDITAVKGTLGDISSRVDSVVDRLDKQAEALRSMYSAYAQRETVLEQVMDGLTKLRAHPAPAPAARL